MAKFKVKAVTKENDSYEETIEAEDRFAVYRDIRARGDQVVDIHEVGKRFGGLSSALTGFLHSVSLDEKVILARNLAAMLEAGLTSSRALAVMERQSKNPRLQQVLSALIADVRRGETLSSSLAKFKDVFSPLLISMVRAGEESGKLAESLRVVAEQMDSANSLKKKIRGAMMYPSIVLIAMLVIGILMLIYVVPTLTQTFEELGTELPPTTQAVIAVSNFLATHTLVALGLIALALASLIAAVRSPRGKSVLDFIFLKLPITGGLVKEINAARTARTLSSLLSAGVDMISAISITGDVVGNVFYQKVLKEAEESVTKGAALSETFKKYPHLYPPLVAEMIAVGEETGRLSGLLTETAKFYETSVERQTKDLSTIIEPLLMVVIGAAVGFFAISMIAPIYSLSDSI